MSVADKVLNRKQPDRSDSNSTLYLDQFMVSMLGQRWKPVCSSPDVVAAVLEVLRSAESAFLGAACAEHLQFLLQR